MTANLFSCYHEKELNIGDTDVVEKAFLDALDTFINDSTNAADNSSVISKFSGGMEAIKSKLDAIMTMDNADRNKMLGEVESKAETYRYKHRISGVPFFIIKNIDNDKSDTLSGAQDPDAFVAIFEK